jgi:hypothetical protein
MTIRRNFLATVWCAVVVTSTITAVHAGVTPSSYFDNVVIGHSDFFVAKIESASTVVAPSGFTCFYKYDSVVTENIHGHFDKGKPFTFFSTLQLRQGALHLIYYSFVDQKQFSNGKLDPEDQTYCQKQLKTVWLTYRDVHELVEEWNGKDFVVYVQFNDPLADLIGPKHDFPQTTHEYEFEYVRDMLLRPPSSAK